MRILFIRDGRRNETNLDSTFLLDRAAVGAGVFKRLPCPPVAAIKEGRSRSDLGAFAQSCFRNADQSVYRRVGVGPSDLGEGAFSARRPAPLCFPPRGMCIPID